MVFGATGDLAQRKLFPGLYRLAATGRLPTEYAVIGSGRHSPGSDDEFRDTIGTALTNLLGGADAGTEMKRATAEFQPVLDKSEAS